MEQDFQESEHVFFLAVPALVLQKILPGLLWLTR